MCFPLAAMIPPFPSSCYLLSRSSNFFTCSCFILSPHETHTISPHLLILIHVTFSSLHRTHIATSLTSNFFTYKRIILFPHKTNTTFPCFPSSCYSLPPSPYLHNVISMSFFTLIPHRPLPHPPNHPPFTLTLLLSLCHAILPSIFPFIPFHQTRLPFPPLPHSPPSPYPLSPQTHLSLPSYPFSPQLSQASSKLPSFPPPSPHIPSLYRTPIHFSSLLFFPVHFSPPVHLLPLPPPFPSLLSHHVTSPLHSSPKLIIFTPSPHFSPPSPFSFSPFQFPTPYHISTHFCFLDHFYSSLCHHSFPKLDHFLPLPFSLPSPHSSSITRPPFLSASTTTLFLPSSSPTNKSNGRRVAVTDYFDGRDT